MKDKEIERQWIGKTGNFFKKLDHLPAVVEITQFYTSIKPESEERYREKFTVSSTKHVKTIKRGTGMSREEIETPVTEEEFIDAMARKVPGSLVIKKKRYKLKSGGITYEIDRYQNPPFDKITIEVEFKSEEDANAFDLPDLSRFFVNPVEVTHDERWKMKNVALHGFPTD